MPTLARLQAAALAVIEDVGYGPELQADMRGFVDVRLRSLRTGSAGRFFEGGHPADIGALLSRNVVLALEDVANDEDKAFVIGTLVIRIVEHLRLRSKAVPSDGLRHVIVLEEAHRLLRAGREGASAHAVELFAGLLAEIRAYGEGVVIAEQIPAKLVPDAVKNTALKVLHRLPAADDRQLVGATMNLDDDQSRQVVSLPPGEAAVFADGMDRPMRIRVPFGGDREQAAASVPDGAGGGKADDTSAPEAGAAPAPSRRWRRRHPRNCRRWRAAGRPPAVTPAPADRPCTLVEIRAADLVARSPQDAWLRVWAEVYVLAHLVNRPRPRVPVPLRQRWRSLDERLRECALATAIDRRRARPGAGAARELRPGGPRRGLRDLGRRDARRRQGRGNHAGHDLGDPAAAVAARARAGLPAGRAGAGPVRGGTAPRLRAAGPRGPAGREDRPAGQRPAPPSAVDGGHPQPAHRLDGAAGRGRPGRLHRGPGGGRDRREPPRPAAARRPARWG